MTPPEGPSIKTSKLCANLDVGTIILLFRKNVNNLLFWWRRQASNLQLAFSLCEWSFIFYEAAQHRSGPSFINFGIKSFIPCAIADSLSRTDLLTLQSLASSIDAAYVGHLRFYQPAASTSSATSPMLTIIQISPYKSTVTQTVSKTFCYIM